MSYVKQTWVTGDVITAEKLNHMEDGIYVSNMLLTLTPGTDGGYVLSETAGDIIDAFEKGANVRLIYDHEYVEQGVSYHDLDLYTLTTISTIVDNNNKGFIFQDIKEHQGFFTSTNINDYPATLNFPV